MDSVFTARPCPECHQPTNNHARWCHFYRGLDQDLAAWMDEEPKDKSIPAGQELRRGRDGQMPWPTHAGSQTRTERK